MKSRRDKVKDMVFIAFLIIIVNLYFITGILLDWQYTHRIQNECMENVLLFVARGAQLLNIEYEGVTKVFTSNFSVILTMLSIVFSVSFTLFNRMERRTLGLSREQFYSHRWLQVGTVARAVILITPLILFIMLRLEFSISIMFTTVFIYVFVMISFGLVAKSYHEHSTRKTVIKRLCKCVPKDIYSQDGFLELRMLIESIRRQIEKDGCWESVEHLFEELTKKLQH